jgi:hypothetical protein
LSFEALAQSGHFSSLDAKLAASLGRLVHGDLSRELNIIREECANKGTFVKGRQILKIIFNHFKVSEAEGQVLNFQDLLNVSLQGDKLRAFMATWDSVLGGMRDVPPEHILEHLFLIQVRKCGAIKEHIAHYDRADIGHPDKNYAYLLRIVRKQIELQRRTQVRDELLGAGGPGAGKALAAHSDKPDKPKAKKGECYQFA